MVQHLELSSSQWDETDVVGTGESGLSGMAMALSSGTTARSTVARKTGGETGITRGSRFDKIDWSKNITIWSRFVIQGSTPTGVSMFSLGKNNSDGVANLSRRGISILRVVDLDLIVQVHDGTTLTGVDLNTTLTATQTYDMRMVSDGAGNVTWYLDDVELGTTNLGPKTESAAVDESNWQMEVANVANSASQALAIFNVQWE